MSLDFLTPGPIDLILGADSYGLFIHPDIIKGWEEEPIAQHTIFGWIVLGPTSTPSATAHSSHHVAMDHELHDLLTKFWIQEEASQLVESRATAQRCLQRRISTDPTYQNLYSSFIREYEELQHMIRVPSSTPEPSLMFYLPHHGVLKDDSITTKLRVVCDGSSLTSTGSSLNDILHTGANLQPDISDILLWVRRHRYIFITDLTKMFRQIQLNIIPYQLTTVTYGTRSAPFLAFRVLLQLVEDEGRNYPLAVPLLLKDRYVYDICSGADTLPELISIAHQLVNLCKAGGFPLAKWQSNHPELFQAISMDGAAVEPHSFDNTQGKILGLTWQPHSDQFVFQSKASNRSGITKRTILSEVAQLFDPLGFLSPVIIRAKTLLQELWLEKVGWNDCLSP
ncbi:uncharacterized protein [Polyergus mexicanus]|uniref:uncharacterized protein n=1 Tax=Polyergus mexicanus TaxID=615972 RepID=UPI0038B4C5E1